MTARPVRLLRGFATVGGWTMASRLLGFVRDVLIAGMLGAGPAAEAFFVAFRLPNMFRRFFAEGAFNMAFVPLFSKRLEGEGAEAARAFAEEAMAVLVAALLVFTAVAMVFMPTLMLALAGGFADEPEKFDLAVLYARIEFPYLLCMSLTALFSGVLNALGRFAAPAAAPILLNVALIGAMGLAAALALPVGDALAWGVLAAGIAQAAMVALAVRAAGFGLRLRRPRLTPGVRRLLRLGAPGAAAAGAMQINLLIGTLVASFFEGAVAWLSYADRLYQLPLGVVGVAVGVVLLPELARRVRAGDAEGGREAMSRAAEFALALTLPAAVALIVAPHLIVGALFERGAFGPEDTRATALAVAIFAAGLPAYVLQKVMQPAFFAREDMDAPLRFALWAMGLNTLISVAGAPAIGFAAIPLGTTVAAWLQLWLLARGARAAAHGSWVDARLRRAAPRMALSAAAMGVCVALAARALGPGLGALAVVVTLGVGVYLAAVAATRALSLRDLRAALRR